MPTPRRTARLGAFLFAWAGLLAPASRAGDAPEPEAGAPLRILDVPYLTQTPELCGGAAAAMVLRYWGEPAATSDFAPLVDAQAHGIPTTALLDAIRARGLLAVAFRATPELVKRELERGHPVIGLIGTGAGQFHYVVMLAWANGRVLLHDPARAPFRVYREADLLSAWRASDGWAAMVLRAEVTPAPSQAPASAESVDRDPGPCRTLVDHGVALARAGDSEPAESSLRAAAELCPDSGAPLLELAGLRFQAQRWRDAADLAREASRLDPEDPHALRTLAASEYLAGDGRQALETFNRLGEPKLGLVRIDGLTRTRFAAIERRLAAEPGSLLTPARLERAQRRVADVPAVHSSRVSYRPTPEGNADLEIAVVERRLFPGLADIPRFVARALNEREIEASFASPTHAGELVGLEWRFPEPRPAFGLRAAVPQPFGAPLLLLTQIRWDTQSYQFGTDAPLTREKQRDIAAAVSDWAFPGVKWELGASLQRLDGRATFLGPIGALEGRAAADRLAVRADVAWLSPLGDDTEAFGTFRLGAAWRSALKEGALLRLRAGWDETSSAAPHSAWSGAGTGAGRAPLLRAHPLLNDDVVTGAMFGRHVLHGGAELEPAHVSLGVLRIGAAAFVDAARATGRAEPGAAGEVDVGAGLRLRLPGNAGAIRFDFSHGVRGASHAFSAGWSAPWPALGVH